jgi:hypothetical protein
VLDPIEVAPVDGYEIPARLRAAVRVRQIADVFPFGTCLSSTMDIDHTERYVSMDYGGPPGQTRLSNLGPFTRPGHRAVTHGGWRESPTRTRLLCAPLTHRLHLPGHQPRHPYPRPHPIQRCHLGSRHAEAKRNLGLAQTGWNSALARISRSSCRSFERCRARIVFTW